MTDPEGTAPDHDRPGAHHDDPDPMTPAELDAELEAVDGELTGSLRELLAPPVDIEDRVATTVSHRLRGGSTLGAAVDLLGLGARTLGLILSDGPEPADRSRDRASPSDTTTDRGYRP